MKNHMTIQTTIDIGNKGENIACSLLKKRGYAILDRNVRGRFGEIDIVAKKDEIFHFIEVRLRSNSTFGTPVETVNEKKRLRLQKTIEYYCLTKGVMNWQLDVMAIQKLEKANKIIFYKNIPLE